MEFATGALGTLIPKLGKLLKHEYDLQKGVKGSIKFLKTELESMQAALRKVSGVPADLLDENTGLWARDVRELSYDIEDSIDIFLVRVKSNKPDDIKGFVCSTLKSLSNIKRRHNMATTIKEFEFLVKQTKERHDRYRVESVVASSPFTSVDPRLEALYKKVNDLVAIDEPSSKLINLLNKEDDASQNNLKTVSIVGTGGLGKTTLAKAVFDKVKVDFQCSAFVSVGQNPNVKKVIGDILLEIDRYTYKDIHDLTRDVKQLIDSLRSFLDDKRYLIVIDDIWDKESWKIIKLAMPENNCGSRVITTSRKFEVAKEASNVYKLEPLSTDHSRQLLYTRIFNDERNSLENLADDELTKKILWKCGGIPLAIITMASLLAGKPREQWFDVYRSISLSGKDNSKFDTTMKILSLSYYDMPSHIRTCLLSLSAYPEDHIIEKESMIWMWIAEGFVQGEGVWLFELGERYLNELINRSMIQPGGLQGRVYGYRLHDLVLELLRSLSRGENFVTVLDKEQGMLADRTVRRLSQQKMRIEHNPEAEVDMRFLRSFVAFSCTIAEMVPFSSFPVLRILALEECQTQNKHLKHLGELLHLRYLRLKDKTISELPKGIGALKFLQTLDLDYTNIQELPSTISQLTQLACLRGGFSVPTNISKLTSLQELELQITSPAQNLQFCEALGNLRELRVLRTYFGNQDSDEEDAFLVLESLKNTLKLHGLRITSYWGFKVEQVSRWHAPGAVLPRHIRDLNLNGLTFSKLPTCIDASALPSLSNLSLSIDFIDYRDMRIFGKFPELWHLHVQSLSMTSLVVYGGDGYGNFRKLKALYVNSYVIVMFKGSKFGAPIMPSLEVLDFGLHVNQLKDYCVHRCQDVSYVLSMLGWHHLPSLKKFNFSITRYNEPEDPVEEETKELLNHAAKSHPNCPTFHIEFSGWDRLHQPDSPKVLDFPVHVWMFRDTGFHFNLTNLAELEKVTAHIYCLYAKPEEVSLLESALRHAAEVHPNNVILEMERLGEEEMDVSFTEQEEQQEDHDSSTSQNGEDTTAATAAQEEVESLADKATNL